MIKFDYKEIAKSPPDSKGMSYTIIKLKVKEFLKAKPFKTQFGPTSRVKMARVKKLQPVIIDAINNSKAPISFDYLGDIVQGCHRQIAARNAVKAGSLSPEMDMFAHLEDKSSSLEIDHRAYLGNAGHARENYKVHLLFGEHPLGYKVAQPIYDVLQAGIGPYFTDDKIYNFAIKLGGYLCKNPDLVNVQLAKGQHFTISAEALYAVREYEGANGNFYNVPPENIKIDLNPFKIQLTKLLTPMFEFVRHAKSSEKGEESLWKEKLGSNNTFIYILMACSIRGALISGTRNEAQAICSKTLLTNFRHSGAKIKTPLKTFTSDPEGKTDTVEGRMGLNRKL